MTAAVTLCESVNPTLPGEGGYAPEASTAVLVKGARPNLCVSPKVSRPQSRPTLFRALHQRGNAQAQTTNVTYVTKVTVP